MNRLLNISSTVQDHSEELHNPELLWLLLVIPFMIVYYQFIKRHTFSLLKIPRNIPVKVNLSKSSFSHLWFWLGCIGFGFLIYGLARPQTTATSHESFTDGIDIIMTLDCSSSMLNTDFSPNRFEAAKNIGAEFLRGRTNDRVGLVVFAGESFTQCPLTIDHQRIDELLLNLKIGILEDGTAVGMGLATSIKRLQDSNSKSKVVILLTDGVNNTGDISPTIAAKLAKELGVKVYTIAIGAKYTTDLFGQKRKNTDLDIETLKVIAQNTGGQFFWAENNDALTSIYEEIDTLETTEIESIKYYEKTDQYAKYLILGGLFLLSSGLLKLLGGIF